MGNRSFDIHGISKKLVAICAENELPIRLAVRALDQAKEDLMNAQLKRETPNNSVSASL